MAILKIVKAEFVKVLKKPMIYIMAFIIVATILASYYFYNPNGYDDKTVYYNNTTDVNLYYSSFTSDDQDSKSVFDAEINKAYLKYNYYSLQNKRRTELNNKYNDIITKYNKLKDEANSSSTGYETARKNAFFNLKKAIQDYQTYYLDFSMFSDYNFVNILTSSIEYKKGKEQLDTIYNTYFAPWDSVSYLEKNAVNPVLQAFEASKYVDKITLINDNSINFITFTLEKYKERVKVAFDNFKTEISKGSSSSPAVIAQYYDKLILTIEDYKDLFEEIVSNCEYPILLLKDGTYDSTYKIGILGIHSEFDNKSNQSQASYIAACDNVERQKYFDLLTTFHEEAEQIYLTSATIDKIVKGKDLCESNQLELLDNITKAVQNTAFSELSTNVTSYKLLAQTINDYIDNCVVEEIASNLEYTNVSDLYGKAFDNYNIYKTNEAITINYHYLLSNTYSNSYINNFSLLNSTSHESNMFDFMYYAMEICTIVIIVFSMVLCASLITQEIESGTIKLLLVRPYKRSTILTSKVLTTLVFSIMFILFSTIISGVAGFVYFGYVSQNVLLVVDATYILTLHPAIVMLINLGSILIDVIFFILVALFFSVMSKNFASTLCFCASSVLLMLGLNLLFGNAFWYSFFPTMNIHLFKYFGNSFIVGSDSIIKKLLITGIASSMNLMYSLIILGIYTVILIALSYAIFNKRDF
ncbi:MAG: ABC transporter permease subunit [Clostridia bacterium]|nr:ABC transporter permease subunit [Clostridia bacterium]